MKVIVMSKKDAEDLKNAPPELLASYAKKGVAVISISSTGAPPANLPAKFKILRLWFDDINDKENGMKIPDLFSHEVLNMHAFTNKQAKQIKQFVINVFNEKYKFLIVHCSAGISRSPAIAIAVLEYLGMTKEALEMAKEKPNYNRDVYQRLSNQVN